VVIGVTAYDQLTKLNRLITQNKETYILESAASEQIIFIFIRHHRWDL
jgi:hypothetical protein